MVDVRAYPASRRHPQFATLRHSLAAAGISYMWEGKMMGGRRRMRKNPPHAALRNDSFRAYADRMMTEGFRHALGALIECASRSGAAIMCGDLLFGHQEQDYSGCDCSQTGPRRDIDSFFFLD